MRTIFTRRLKDADAVLILTDWKEFAKIDLVRLNKAVRFPIVIDGRNLYQPKQMLDHGFYLRERRPADKLSCAGGKPRKLVRLERLPTDASRGRSYRACLIVQIWSRDH